MTPNLLYLPRRETSHVDAGGSEQHKHVKCPHGKRPQGKIIVPLDAAAVPMVYGQLDLALDIVIFVQMCYFDKLCLGSWIPDPALYLVWYVSCV